MRIMTRSRAVLLVALFALAACSGGTDSTEPVGPPAHLELVSGPDQSGYVGTTLAQPLVVRVTDAKGRGVADQPITWQVDDEGGTISVVDSATGADGTARAEWTLGLQVGTFAVSAAVTGVPPVSFTATSMADTVAPQVSGFALTPAALDVTQAEDTVTFTVQASDNASGIAVVWIIVRKPDGSVPGACGTLEPASGSRTDGTWECRFIIPKSAMQGEWTIDGIEVQDRVLNDRRYTSAELTAAGFPTSITVTSAEQDVTAPTLASLSFTPSAVDVTAAAATITFTARFTDAGSGVRAAQLNIQATAGSPTSPQWAECLEMTRDTGSPADGTWSCDVTIPKGAIGGEWQVNRVWAWDVADNLMMLTTADLTDAGQPTSITVTSASADTIPPVLTAFSITPDTVDVSTSAALVTFTASIEDAGSGLTFADVILRAPGASSANGCRLQRTSGTASAGTYSCSWQISEFSSAGEWGAEVSLKDVTGNARGYSPAQLEAAGFTGSVIVTR
jgi:hypothetical protein